MTLPIPAPGSMLAAMARRELVLEERVLCLNRGTSGPLPEARSE